MKRTLIRLGLTALVSSALFGCGGGSDGVNGSSSTVTVPINVSNKQTVASNTATPSSASVAAWRALQPQVTVTGVTINSPPVVSFAVTDADGNAVVGLGNQSQASTARYKSLTNLSFTLAKLVPGATPTEPSKWVSYLVTKPTTVSQLATSTVPATESCTPDFKWCGTYPTTDKEGTLVDNGDGTYKYTFARDVKLAKSIVDSLVNSTDTLKLKADLGDLTYDPSLTHRLGIVISGAAPGTGSNVPNATQAIPGTNIAIAANKLYDFRPDGGAVTVTRNVVDISSCASCHNGKGLAHGGGRKDPNLCVTCHTDQIKYGMSGEASRTALVLTGTTQNTTSVIEGRAIGNYPNFVHKIHMGDKLKLTGYNYIPSAGVGMQFEKDEWIQDPRNCTKCHNGSDKTDNNQATKTADGNNWKTKPNRLACGACHDNISFAATPSVGLVAHTGGSATDDVGCAGCHSSGGAAGAIEVSHRTESATANNPTPIAGISDFDYVIKSVAVDKTTGVTTFKFVINQDGSPVKVLTTGTQAIAGFNSGPSLYLAFAVPQDGVASPADFNAYVNISLANLIAGTNGSLAVDSATGIWTATIAGASLKIPTTGTGAAKMVTGAIIGNFTQVDFNATKTAGLVDVTTDLGKKWNIKPVGSANYLNGTGNPGLFAKTPLQKVVATSCVGATCTSYTARRVVVEKAKCESCHEQLGTAVEFHSGARNDPTACAICHNTSRTSSAWSANASTFIHGIHAGTNPTTVATITAGVAGVNSTADVGVPGTGSGGAGTAFSTGKRTIPFSWHRAGTATVPTWNAAAVVYPGILKRCDNCHVPNAVNFGADGANLLPNLLWSTSASGNINYASDAVKAYPRDPVTGGSPHANLSSTAANAFGSGFSYNATTAVTTPAAGTTLVESPISAACFACHDSSTARTHFGQYGGTIYGTRTAAYSTTNTATTYGGQALDNKETCLICHGMGRDQDAAVVHAK